MNSAPDWDVESEEEAIQTASERYWDEQYDSDAHYQWGEYCGDGSGGWDMEEHFNIPDDPDRPAVYLCNKGHIMDKAFKGPTLIRQGVNGDGVTHQSLSCLADVDDLWGGICRGTVTVFKNPVVVVAYTMGGQEAVEVILVDKALWSND